METKTLYTGIAVVVAMAFFIIVFGRSFFPNVALLNYFTFSIFENRTTTSTDVSSSVSRNDTVVSEPSEIFDIIPGAVIAQDIKVGNGLLANDGNTVFVGYRVTFLDQQTREIVVADENFNRENPLVFEIGSDRIIPGFNLGVLGMREGGIRALRVAPAFAYGENRAGVIPPNTELTFEIHLYEVRE